MQVIALNCRLFIWYLCGNIFVNAVDSLAQFPKICNHRTKSVYGLHEKEDGDAQTVGAHASTVLNFVTRTAVLGRSATQISGHIYI
jgi:hypothetical protein